MTLQSYDLHTAQDFTNAAINKAHRGAHREVLEAAHAAMYNLEQAVSASVYAARAQGESWTSIGMALGITKQAAQQRYGREALANWAHENDTDDLSQIPARHLDPAKFDSDGNYYPSTITNA